MYFSTKKKKKRKGTSYAYNISKQRKQKVHGPSSSFKPDICNDKKILGSHQLTSNNVTTECSVVHRELKEYTVHQ